MARDELAAGPDVVDADGGVVEQGAEPPFGLAQRRLRLPYLGDVARGGEHPTRTTGRVTIDRGVV